VAQCAEPSLPVGDASVNGARTEPPPATFPAPSKGAAAAKLVCRGPNLGDSMDFKTTNLFFSLLALVANGVTVAALIAVVMAWRNGAVADRLRFTLGIGPRVLALAVAATCMFGSLLYQLHFDRIPCVWCWYQRIAMYPLVAILLVGLILRDRLTGWYVIPFVVIGPLMSTYHWLLERGVFPEVGSCDPTAPCAAPPFREFGFITLAYMAWSGFLAIGALMLLDAVIHRGASIPESSDVEPDVAPDPEVLR